MMKDSVCLKGKFFYYCVKKFLFYIHYSYKPRGRDPFTSPSPLKRADCYATYLFSIHIHTTTHTCIICSGAIMKYLVQRFHLADHWYPRDLKKRAKIDEYLDWHHTHLRVGAAHTIFQKVKYSYCIVL